MVAVPVWVKDTAERAARTFAQSFLAVAGYTGIGSHFDSVQWVDSANVAAVATIFSLLMSFVATAAPIGQPGTASTVDLEPAKSIPPKAARESRRRARHERADGQ
jgi:Putative lactococcus lactis phage r1t holin